MIIGHAAGTNFLPAQSLQKADASSRATSAKLPEGCDQFLGTHNCEHLASSILSGLGGETDPAALAMACFEKVAKP
jgi:hypothetical protein